MQCKPAGPARPKSILTFSIVDRRRSQAKWFDVMLRRAHSVHFSYAYLAGANSIATAMRRMLVRSLPAVALIACTAEAADHEKLMKNLKVERGGNMYPSRDKTKDPSLTQYIRRRTKQEACFEGWQTSCQDNPLYVSPIQTDCSTARNVFGASCVQALAIGFTASQLNELIRNCPCSCEIECGTLQPLHHNDSEDGGARTKEQDSDDDGLCYAENRTEQEEVSTFGIDFSRTLYFDLCHFVTFTQQAFALSPSDTTQECYQRCKDRNDCVQGNGKDKKECKQLCRTNCCKNSASSGAIRSSVVAVSTELEEEYLVKDGGGFTSSFQTLMDEYGIFIYAGVGAVVAFICVVFVVRSYQQRNTSQRRQDRAYSFDDDYGGRSKVSGQSRSRVSFWGYN